MTPLNEDGEILQRRARCGPYHLYTGRQLVHYDERWSMEESRELVRQRYTAKLKSGGRSLWPHLPRSLRSYRLAFGFDRQGGGATLYPPASSRPLKPCATGRTRCPWRGESLERTCPSGSANWWRLYARCPNPWPTPGGKWPSPSATGSTSCPKSSADSYPIPCGHGWQRVGGQHVSGRITELNGHAEPDGS